MDPAPIEPGPVSAGECGVATLPAPLLSRNPLAWLALFGPGAIIASLTIGTGELIFSARGGVLFGYRILFLFVLVSLLKWALVFALARQMVISGVHPCGRLMDLPGPRGWFPLMLLMLAAATIPVWVGFHCGVLGNLTSWVTGTQAHFNGGADYVWGGLFLAGAIGLSLAGGYSVLERAQLAIVMAMVLCGAVSLVLYQPDWLEMLEGTFMPQSYHYPPWLDRLYPEIARQPVWVEITRYVGVIGGGGFDYLAYVSFLRDKQWGRAGHGEFTRAELERIPGQSRHALRQWVRAPLVDCTVSFVVVVAFSAVFVASGVVVLGKNRQLPTEDSWLNLQARFVTSIHPWLLPLYVAGAFLTMLGTLYGTIEVAHVILREFAHAYWPALPPASARRLKWIAVSWCGMLACAVLIGSLLFTWRGGAERPRLLLAVLTPANLFTGVLLCGLLCLSVRWMDVTGLPRTLRMPAWLLGLNVGAGMVFLGLGLKGYWDNHQPAGSWLVSRWFAMGAILAIAAVSVAMAAVHNRRPRNAG